MTRGNWSREQQIAQMETVTCTEVPLDLPFPRIQVRKHIGTAGGGFSPVKRVLEWDVELFGLDGNKQLVNVYFSLEDATKRAEDLQQFHGWEIYFVVEHILIERKTVFKVLAHQQKPQN